MATLRDNINQASADFQSIKNKIVGKGVNVTDGTPTWEYADKIDAVYEVGYTDSEKKIDYLNSELEQTLYGTIIGGKSYYDTFWDIYQDGGNRTAYVCAFGGNGWTNETFKPKYNLVVGDGYMMFRNAKITGHLGEILSARGLSLSTSGIYSSNYMFSFCNFTGLPTIDVSNSHIGSNMFGSSTIVTIDKIIVNAKTEFYGDSFHGLTNLQNLVIEGEIAKDIDISRCTQLTEPSIRSIITHLSDTASGKTLTLSKTAVEKAFVYGVDPDGDGEYDWPFDEGAWDNLVATKPNWQISLV
jgi:hypothetical protein